MKNVKNALLAVVILLVLPALSYSHPGKTNRYGGHKCIKGCGEWGLFYEEYHLHDKDGRPIRVERRKKAKTPGIAGLVTSEAATSAQTSLITNTTETVLVTSYRYVTNVYEENLFMSNPLIYILLMLLILLLVFRMNRRREER
jgi:hypothetical protein